VVTEQSFEKFWVKFAGIKDSAATGRLSWSESNWLIVQLEQRVETIKRMHGMLADSIKLIDSVNPGGQIFDNNFKRSPDGITDQMIFDRICEEVVDGDADFPCIDFSILTLRTQLEQHRAVVEAAKLYRRYWTGKNRRALSATLDALDAKEKS